MDAWMMTSASSVMNLSLFHWTTCTIPVLTWDRLQVTEVEPGSKYRWRRKEELITGQEDRFYICIAAWHWLCSHPNTELYTFEAFSLTHWLIECPLLIKMRTVCATVTWDVCTPADGTHLRHGQAINRYIWRRKIPKNSISVLVFQVSCMMITCILTNSTIICMK